MAMNEGENMNDETAEMEPENDPEPETQRKPPKLARGFAVMDRERVRQIASRGGKAAHASGTAHQFTREEAREAGRKGGKAPHVSRGGKRKAP